MTAVSPVIVLGGLWAAALVAIVGAAWAANHDRKPIQPPAYRPGPPRPLR